MPEQHYPPLDPKVKITHRNAVEAEALWDAILTIYQCDGQIPEELGRMLNQRLTDITRDLAVVIMHDNVPF